MSFSGDPCFEVVAVPNDYFPSGLTLFLEVLAVVVDSVCVF